MSKAKKKAAMLVMAWLVLAGKLAGFSFYPQAGAEYYFGANKFRSWKPWAGVRTSLSPYTSLLLKYTFHDLSFEYQREDGSKDKRETNLSQLISAVYYARQKLESYAALSYFHGSDSYSAWNLDIGASWKIATRIGLEAGLYLLDESSILWYPDEPVRRIQVGAVRTGLEVELIKGCKLNPQLYFYRNSEDISASTFAMTLVIIPREPFTFVFTFWHYRESAQYRFSGQYFSLGLNLYY